MWKLTRIQARSRSCVFVAAWDGGRAIHPSYVEGQIQGGMQGIGWALNEEYIYGEDGKLQNAGFLDYRVPVTSDVPMIEPILVEVLTRTIRSESRALGKSAFVHPCQLSLTRLRMHQTNETTAHLTTEAESSYRYAGRN